MNHINIKHIVGIIFLSLLCNCTSLVDEKIIFTRDYIINPNWTGQNSTLDIVKMVQKDSTKVIDPKNTNYIDLSNKLMKDLSFSFGATITNNGVSFSERKIYFNKDNGFSWWKDVHDSKSSRKILGELELETWYLLYGLSNDGSAHFVYIDSDNTTYQYKKLASNW